MAKQVSVTFPGRSSGANNSKMLVILAQPCVASLESLTWRTPLLIVIHLVEQDFYQYNDQTDCFLIQLPSAPAILTKAI